MSRHRFFLDIGYLSYRGKEHLPQVKTFKLEGNEFYSINLEIAIDDEPPLIDGALIYSYAVLNDYLRKKRRDKGIKHL